MENFVPFKVALARIGNISPSTAYRMANEGRLQIRKIGRRSYITETEIKRILETAPVAPLDRTSGQAA